MASPAASAGERAEPPVPRAASPRGRHPGREAGRAPAAPPARAGRRRAPPPRPRHPQRGEEQHHVGRAPARRPPPPPSPRPPPPTPSGVAQRHQAGERAGQRRERRQVRPAGGDGRQHQPEDRQPAQPADRQRGRADAAAQQRVPVSRTVAASATTASRYQPGRYGSSSSAYPGRTRDRAPRAAGRRPGRARSGTRASPNPAASRGRGARRRRRASQPSAATASSGERRQRPGQPAGIADQRPRAPGSTWRLRPARQPGQVGAAELPGQPQRVLAVVLEAAAVHRLPACPGACGRSPRRRCRRSSARRSRRRGTR